jgi:type I restriction enzyme, S subunit
MGGEWKEMSLAGIVTILGDGLHGTPEYSKFGEFHFVNGNNLENGYVLFKETTKRIDRDQYVKHKKNLDESTVLVAINGTIGNFALYRGERVVLGKSVCYFNVKSGVDRRFISYVLRDENFQNYIDLQATGTTIKNVSLKTMREFKFKLPPLPEQRAIAHILGSLDDKIALNRKMNATLEAMAQALFQSWFVDFDPVIDKALAAGHEIPEPFAAKARRRAALGDRRKLLPAEVAALFPDRFVETEEMGWVPEGWEVGRLDQVADIVGGATPSTAQPEYFTENGIPWLSPKDLSGYTWKFIARGATDITVVGLKNSSARLMPKGTVLFSSRAPIGYVAIAENDVTTNQGFKSLVPKNGVGNSFLYAFMKVQKAQIEAIATGSTFKEISATAMKAYPILIPAISLLRTYEGLLAGGNEKQLLLQKETATLTALRDTLLPKLISGELRLRDAEATLQSVLP